MNQRNVAFVLLVTIAVIAVTVLVGQKMFGRRQQQSNEYALICHVEHTLVWLENGGDEESFECNVVSVKENSTEIPDMAITVDLPANFILEHRKSIDEGDFYIQIPGGSINQDVIAGFGPVSTNVNIPPNAEITILNANDVRDLRHHRKRQRRTSELRRELVGGIGTRTVMVFRVTTDDASPEIGATEIEERMFSPTQFSLASQFDKCSFGELTFVPHDSKTPVIELYVPGAASSFNERTILNAATRQAAEIYGDDIWDRADHAVFCMPDGTSGKGYIAYSGVGSFFSVFHNLRCAYPTTVMHEIAHNCGLGHAFENGEEYGDETTIMGFSSSSKTGPSKCFNGQNIWQLGWFKSRSVVVDPFEGHHLVELAPFVDFDTAYSYQAVLVTVLDMHLVYNRAKEFNAETSEYQNKVTITKEVNEINSELIAVMDMENPTFTINDYVVAGTTLHVEICETVNGEGGADYIVIAIGLDPDMCPTTTPKTGMPSSTTPKTGMPSSTPTQHPIATWPSVSPTFVPTLPKLSDPPITQTLNPTNNEDPPLIIDVSAESPESVPLEEDTLQTPFEEIQVAKERPILDDPAETAVQSITSSSETVNSVETMGTRVHSESENIALAFLLSSIVALSICCACAATRCYQRKLEEQKRNLRVLHLEEGSRHVKVYMKNPL